MQLKKYFQKIWTIIFISLSLCSQNAVAQVIGGFGGDEVSSTVDRVINYLQTIGIGLISIFIITNLISMAKDGQEGDRAKSRVITGLIAIAGLMLLRPLVNLVQSLTGSSFFLGY